jgi:hypothetical protein
VSRDAIWENETFDRIRSDCLRLHGFDGEAYVSAIQQRLAIGAERYGDDAYMDRDNMTELLEETPDVGAYSMLEIQRLMEIDADAPGEVADHLWQAIMAGAVADHHARRVRQLMRNG